MNRTPFQSKLLQSARNTFCQTIHSLILLFLAWLLVVYFIAPQTLVALHLNIEPVTHWLIFFVPYIQWLVNTSHAPELTLAFIEMTYLCFVLLFMNLFLAVSPAFSGVPKRDYLLSINGFADFLEENIFSKLSPSISLVSPSERFWGRGIRGKQTIDANSFKQIIVVYLKNAAGYYGLMLVCGFIFLPWLAYTKINSVGLTGTPSWLAIIFMAYLQIRCVFEVSVLLLPVLTKHQSDSVVTK